MSVLDIVGIKSEIKSILETNNTTTSSIHNLSASMADQVKKVMTLNPEKINVLAGVYPFVTVYTDKKDISQQDIAVNQVQSKRRSELELEIVGAVWEPNFVSDPTADPADNNLEYLMENIEQILRNYPTLNGKVTWQMPSQADYFSLQIDEEAHLRMGTLKLRCSTFY